METNIPIARSISISYSVADLLLASKGLKPELIIALQPIAQQMGLPEGEYTFSFGYYPTNYPVTPVKQRLTKATTASQLLLLAALVFEEVYGVVDPETGTSALLVPQMCNCEMMVHRFDDQMNIIGKWVSTPFFEQIDIDTKAKTVHFRMGT